MEIHIINKPFLLYAGMIQFVTGDLKQYPYNITSWSY